MDGIAKLRLATVTVPSPSKGQLLIKMRAVALNYKDGEVLNGLMKHHKTATFPKSLVPCSDGVGEVIEIGEGVTKFQKGDRVLSLCFPLHQTGQIQAKDLQLSPGMTAHGCLTEYKTIDDWAVVKAPPHLSDSEAVTFPIAGTTAWMAINGLRPLGQPGGQGQTMLVQGTGGVSMMGLVLGKASGMNGTYLMHGNFQISHTDREKSSSHPRPMPSWSVPKPSEQLIRSIIAPRPHGMKKFFGSLMVKASI
jgi:NADPH:quinone reductase-like Zn-dependent oxidoreductase